MSGVDVLAVRWLLADARTQRRYEREDLGRVMVKSAPSPRSVLRSIQRDLLRIRIARVTGGAA